MPAAKCLKPPQGPGAWPGVWEHQGLPPIPCSNAAGKRSARPMAHASLGAHFYVAGWEAGRGLSAARHQFPRGGPGLELRSGAWEPMGLLLLSDPAPHLCCEPTALGAPKADWGSAPAVRTRGGTQALSVPRADHQPAACPGPSWSLPKESITRRCTGPTGRERSTLPLRAGGASCWPSDPTERPGRQSSVPQP